MPVCRKGSKGPLPREIPPTVAQRFEPLITGWWCLCIIFLFLSFFALLFLHRSLAHSFLLEAGPDTVMVTVLGLPFLTFPVSHMTDAVSLAVLLSLSSF